jgi:hypothetical protein
MSPAGEESTVDIVYVGIAAALGLLKAFSHLPGV